MSSCEYGIGKPKGHPLRPFMGLDRGNFQRKVYWGASLVAALGLVVLGYAPVLRWIGAILIVEDPLRPAAAIVVLGGHIPFRAMEGADLYRAGWAPRLVLVRGPQKEEQRALRTLGVTAPEEWEISREVLIRGGVPPAAILVPPEEGDGTDGELSVVAKALKPGNSPVILVTSKVHTRRVHLTWQYVTEGRSQGITRVARQDPFDPRIWWRERRFILEVVREYLGLVNYWMGFPVKGTVASGEWRVAREHNRSQETEVPKQVLGARCEVPGRGIRG